MKSQKLCTVYSNNNNRFAAVTWVSLC